jgi:hypothetical protein
MRVRRAVIISAILALGAAGSILASSAHVVAVAQAPSSQVLTTSSSVSPGYIYMG